MDEAITYEVIQRAALAFVLETETWPVFLAYVGDANRTSDALQNWLKSAPDLNKIRREWMRHSDDAVIRALAEL